MRTLAFAGLAAAAILAAPAALSPAMAQANAPTDTGNMAYPQPRATGQLGNRPAPTGRDVGNMAYPQTNRPGQTTRNNGTANAPTDTGSMALPQPGAAGTLPPTRTR